VNFVTLDDPRHAEGWLALICATYDEATTADDVWAAFSQRLPAVAAGSVGAETAKAWIAAVDGQVPDPAGLLADMAARRGDLADLYAGADKADDDPAAYVAAEAAPEAATHAAEASPEGSAADEGPFGWLSARPNLAARVETVLQYQPEHYESHLGPYLEQLWGAEWNLHPAEHKRAWLEAALADLEQAEPAPAEAGAAASADAEAEPEPEATELSAVEQGIADALAEALAEVPEAGGLSEEEIAAVLAEVIAEQASIA
jgi:hypothetical protein